MKTAFSAFVFGTYEKFIPFYIYCIQKNYPDSDIVLFYHTTLSNNIKEITEQYPDVTVYENFYQDYGFFKEVKIKGGGLKLLRHLVKGKYFENYDAVYFGDVDILILDENESLFEFHIKQADACNLPFSNKVRKLPEGGLSTRLTGLHFVKVKPYYEKLNPVIENLLSDKKLALNFLEGIERDEQFLYKLNQTAFNFNPEQVAENERPWHGFHLGLVRGKNFLNKKQISENSSLSYKDIRLQLEALVEEKSFVKLLQKVYCPELFYTFIYFDIKLPHLLILKYFLWKPYIKLVNKVNVTLISGKKK